MGRSVTYGFDTRSHEAADRLVDSRDLFVKDFNRKYAKENAELGTKLVIDSPTEFAGLKVHRATELQDWGMCIVIYGPPGVGKTTLAADAADSDYGKRVLFLDAEGGTRSVSHRNDIDVIKVPTNKELQAALKAVVLSGNDCPWKTIVLDNMSEIQAVVLRSITTEAPQIQHYGACTVQMLALTRMMRDIAQRQSINTILIAWDAPEKDESTGVVKRDVGFTPSLARQFPGIVDIVGYLTVVNNPPTYTRRLSFAPSPTTAAKFRKSRNERATQIPYELFYDIETSHPMVDLLATMRGGVPFPKETYLPPTRQQKE